MTLLLRTRLSGKYIYDPNNIPREVKKKKVNGAYVIMFFSLFQLYKLTKPFELLLSIDRYI